jgi:hypothetical protein
MTKTASKTTPKASRGEHFYNTTKETFDLSETELELLETCSRFLDEIDLLQEAIDRDGLTVQGAAGQTRIHPAVSELRQHRLALGRLLAQLQLPNEDGEKLASPAQAKSRKANQVRWGTRG